MNKLLRECIFVAVFILLVVLIVGFLFIEFIPNEIIPEPSKYKQSSSTSKLLAQISEEQNSESEEEEKESVLQSYEVTRDNLEYSEKELGYSQGKNHPFYNYFKVTEDGESVIVDVDANQTTNGNSQTQNTTNQSGSETNSNSVNNTNKINTNTLRDTSNANKVSK